ncbi:MAG: hypothetical protein L3J74_09340 [Bacteroidales bacterium]|nr:hypothetical protein [Bacteroidales bacterium]
MKKLIIIFSILLSVNNIKAQVINDSVYHSINKGIIIPIGNNKNFFLKTGVSAQIWMRLMQYNNGISDIDNSVIKYDADVLIRRMFFPVYLKLGNFTFFTLPAFSSQPATASISSSTPQQTILYFYDIWTSYQLWNGKLIVGAGLNMYNGVSRYSSASSARTLGADVPLIAAPNLTSTEQAARQLSLFFTGNLNAFAYRLAIAKPFAADNVPEHPEIGKIYNYHNAHFSYKGYFEYQFFDKESNLIPFKSATYISSKKILNLGLGFDYHPQATLSFNADSSITKYDKLHFAADIFSEIPFNNHSTATFYASYYICNYGPEYTQSFGVQELYRNSLSELQYGTGNAVFIQAAYLLPAAHLSNRIQLYYEVTLRDFEGAPKKVYHHNTGVNYFIVGHKIKYTLQYENRPVFEEENIVRKSLVIGKIQIGI